MMLNVDSSRTAQRDPVVEAFHLPSEDPFRIDRFDIAVRKGFEDIERGACVTLHSREEIDTCIDQLWAEALKGLPTPHTDV